MYKLKYTLHYIFYILIIFIFSLSFKQTKNISSSKTNTKFKEINKIQRNQQTSEK